MLHWKIDWQISTSDRKYLFFSSFAKSPSKGQDLKLLPCQVSGAANWDINLNVILQIVNKLFFLQLYIAALGGISS